MTLSLSRELLLEVERGLKAAKYAGFYAGIVDGKPWRMIRDQYKPGWWRVTVAGVYVGMVQEPGRQVPVGE